MKDYICHNYSPNWKTSTETNTASMTSALTFTNLDAQTLARNRPAIALPGKSDCSRHCDPIFFVVVITYMSSLVIKFDF